MSQNRATRLLDACASGDEAQVRQLLDGLSIRAPHDTVIPFVYDQDISQLPDDKPPPTLLMLRAATEHGHRPVVSLLLSVFPKAIPTVTDVENAVTNGDLEMLEQLLQHNPRCVCGPANREDSFCPLASACYTNTDAALLMLKYGARPLGTDFFQRSALQAALDLDNRAPGTVPDIRVVQGLLKASAYVDEKALALSASLEPAFATELLRTQPDRTTVKRALSQKLNPAPMRNEESVHLLREYATGSRVPWYKRMRNALQSTS